MACRKPLWSRTSMLSTMLSSINEGRDWFDSSRLMRVQSMAARKESIQMATPQIQGTPLLFSRNSRTKSINPTRFWVESVGRPNPVLGRGCGSTQPGWSVSSAFCTTTLLANSLCCIPVYLPNCHERELQELKVLCSESVTGCTVLP